MARDYPPADEAGFLDFARSPIICDLTKDAGPSGIMGSGNAGGLTTPVWQPAVRRRAVERKLYLKRDLQ